MCISDCQFFPTMLLHRSLKHTRALVEETDRLEDVADDKMRLGFRFVLIVLTETNTCMFKVLLKASVFQFVSSLPDKASPVLLSCRIQGQHQCQVCSVQGERGHRVVVVAERLDSIR